MEYRFKIIEQYIQILGVVHLNNSVQDILYFYVFNSNTEYSCIFFSNGIYGERPFFKHLLLKSIWKYR